MWLPSRPRAPSGLSPTIKRNVLTFRRISYRASAHRRDSPVRRLLGAGLIAQYMITDCVLSSKYSAKGGYEVNLLDIAGFF